MKRFRGPVRVLILMAIPVLTILGVALVPLALGWIGKLITADWEGLGNIGDAYGVASAMFSALAFLAVAASIAYQARAYDQQRRHASRDRQLELLRLVLDDPETYAASTGRDPGSMTRREMQRDVFAQMLMLHLLDGYRTGRFSERDLRAEDGAPRFFETESNRRFWRSGNLAMPNSHDPVLRRFGSLMQEAYEAALTRPARDDVPAPVSPKPARAGRDHAVLALGVSAALAVGWLAGSRRHR